MTMSWNPQTALQAAILCFRWVLTEQPCYCNSTSVTLIQSNVPVGVVERLQTRYAAVRFTKQTATFPVMHSQKRWKNNPASGVLGTPILAIKHLQTHEVVGTN